MDFTKEVRAGGPRAEQLPVRFEVDQQAEGICLSEDLEILYVLSGRTALFCRGRNLLLHTSDLAVFNSFEAHEIFTEPGGHVLTCTIDASILRRYHPGEIDCCSVGAGERGVYLDRIRRHLSVMYKILYSGTEDQDLYVMSELFGLLSILQEHFARKEDVRHAGGGQDWDEIRSVLEYLQDNYGFCGITLQNTADRFHLSSSTLSRKFERTTGIAFSDYLRMIRLKEAALRLRSSRSSVTEISEECGFTSLNTMIRTFRERYGTTPHQYRKRLAAPVLLSDAERDEQTQMALLSFLRYAMEQEAMQPLAKPQASSERITIDRGPAIRSRRSGVSRVYLCRLASDFLSEDSWVVLDRCLSSLRFTWIHVMGIFDDALGIYRRTPNGERSDNFRVLDSILERLLTRGKLWLEFSRVPRAMIANPRQLYQDEYMDLPDSPEEWGGLVRRFMLHICGRFGEEAVSSWRFSVMPPTLTLFEQQPFDRYLDFYRATVLAVRGVLPNAQIVSGAFDMNLLSLDRFDYLGEFLDYASNEECLPDVLSLQDFQRDYRRESLPEAEAQLLKEGTGEQMNEPAPPSPDPQVFRQDIARVQAALHARGLSDIPVSMIYWNVTNWPYDLSCDTCYTSAFYTKHLVENEDLLESCSFRMWDTDDGELEFYGGTGLMTRRMIPKAGWQALRLYDRLEQDVLQQGDGYIVTGNSQRSTIAILMYNYCHYNLRLHLREVLVTSEQQSLDRYSAFEGSGTKAFLFSISCLPGTHVTVESFAVNREHGSTYDIWKKMGAPARLQKAQAEYLLACSVPEYHIEEISDLKHEMLNVPEILDEHEIKLVIIHLDEPK